MLRVFDILLSLLAMVILLPILILLFIWIKIDSKGPAFFVQTRVGKGCKDFRLIKFRSMRVGAHTKSLLTIGNSDARITRAGFYMRKYKLDELPQLINVLIGTMSMVGPRPEVRKYFDLYSPEQIKVVSVKPGLTDYASIHFIDENEILSKSIEPEKTYIEQILPRKIEMNMIYINNQNIRHYFRIIFLTLKKILSHG
jgi:lipopolysaccharide/colanic/teichoic acid biosynthesis glycosyltransferase